MKIEHKKAAPDPLQELTPLERRCLNVAVILSFVGVFVWFFKILFL
jgi:hypothetical protein